MSLPQQTLHRLPKIKAGLLIGSKTYEIAKECGVTEKTIDRDLKAWRISDAFEDWLREEWMRLHAIIQEKDPQEAYRQLTKLIGHTFVRKIESKEQIEVKEIRLSWNIDEHSTTNDKVRATSRSTRVSQK